MPVIETENALEIGRGHHRAGRLAEAEECYRRVLACTPNHPDALHLLGVLAGQTGRTDEGIALIESAIAADPDVPQYHNNLGNLLRERGRLNDAIEAYRAAARLNPAYAEAHNNLGHGLSEAGQHREAAIAYGRAVELKPDLPHARANLADALRDSGQLAQAAGAYARAITSQPDLADLHNNFGTVLRDLGQIEEAIAQYHAALRLDPKLPAAHNNLGVARMDQGSLDAAIDAFGRAIVLDSNYADAHANLGIGLYAIRRPGDAIAACRRAIAIDPGFARAHSNLALVLLGCGEFAEGWVEHEWRYQCSPTFRPRAFAQPRWDGSELPGRTLLLHAEQGFGDTIQFVRFVSLAAARAGRVVLEVQPELVKLLEHTVGVAPVIARGEPPPQFDVHCPLMSLPAALGTTLDTLPAKAPYIHTRPAMSGDQKPEWESGEDALDVGLVWAGRPTHSNDRNRSIALARLAPLASLKGIRFHSLQHGPAAVEAATPPDGLQLIDHSSDIADFADTANLIAKLDLIISVDTAVAHLAGAMGKPAWVLLPYAADWRWMIDRDDSPWYPTLRLFRQDRWGDWDQVIERVVHGLSHARSPFAYPGGKRRRP